MEKSVLHKRIMRRVYFIHLLKWTFSPRKLKLGAFALSIVGLASFVSVGSVISNMPLGDVSALLNFTVYAFTHTALQVQVLSIIAGACLVWYMRDLIATTPRLAFS